VKKILGQKNRTPAERLVNEHGGYVTAEFPDGLMQAAQYGNDVKAHGV
jgi:hypothetical protein